MKPARKASVLWNNPVPGGSMSAPTLPPIANVIGRIPFRLALAGGWIDQPFVSRLNPKPPGSMVVVSIEPTFSCMERCGMATSTRKVATRLWGEQLPKGDPATLVRELYRSRKQRQGRAVRLAGHGRLDLSGHQPAGLRLLGQRRRVPQPHRVAQQFSRHPLAGEGHPCPVRCAAARRIQSARRKKPRSEMDRAVGTVGQGLFRRHHAAWM